MQLTTNSNDGLKPYVFNFVKSTGEVQVRYVPISEYAQRRVQCYQAFLRPGKNRVEVYKDGRQVETLRAKFDYRPGDAMLDNLNKVMPKPTAEELKQTAQRIWMERWLNTVDDRRMERARRLQREVVIESYDGLEIKATVPSSTGGKWHVTVIVGQGYECNCEDYVKEVEHHPDHICKHVAAVMLAVLATWPTVVTKGHRVALRAEFEREKQRIAHPELG